MEPPMTDTIAPTTFIMGDPFAQEVAGPNVRLNVVTPIIEIGNGWLRVIALASTQDAAVKIVAALQQKSPGSHTDANVTVPRDATPAIVAALKQVIWKNTWSDAALKAHWQNLLLAAQHTQTSGLRGDDCTNK
jgi:hypothetical protein